MFGHSFKLVWMDLYDVLKFFFILRCSNKIMTYINLSFSYVIDNLHVADQLLEGLVLHIIWPYLNMLFNKTIRQVDDFKKVPGIIFDQFIQCCMFRRDWSQIGLSLVSFIAFAWSFGTYLAQSRNHASFGIVLYLKAK